METNSMNFTETLPGYCCLVKFVPFCCVGLVTYCLRKNTVNDVVHNFWETLDLIKSCIDVTIPKVFDEKPSQSGTEEKAVELKDGLYCKLVDVDFK